MEDRDYDTLRGVYSPSENLVNYLLYVSELVATCRKRCATSSADLHVHSDKSGLPHAEL